LVNWYLEEVFPKSINFSQEEFLLKKQIVEKVIERLIYTDNILLAISKPGFLFYFFLQIPSKTKNLKFTQ